MQWKWEWKSRPTLRPQDYTVHGILQAKILVWVAFPFFRASFQPRDWNQVCCIEGGFFYQLTHKGSPKILEWVAYPFSSGSSPSRNQNRVSCIAGGCFTNWTIREAHLWNNSVYNSLLLTISLLNLNFPEPQNSFHSILSQELPINRAENLFSSCSHKIWNQCWIFFPYTWKIDLSHII